MYLTARQAAELLATAGLCRRQSRRLLDSGLAGEPVVTRAAHLYREDRLRELLSWPEVTYEQLETACPSLLFLARRLVDVRRERSEQLAAAARRWQIGLMESVVIRAEVARRGFVPFLATVGGFVAVGADITDVLRSGPGIQRDLVLDEPGEWFELLRGRRMAFGPGHGFYLLGWPPRQPRPEASMGQSPHPTPEENA